MSADILEIVPRSPVLILFLSINMKITETVHFLKKILNYYNSVNERKHESTLTQVMNQ